MRERSDEALMKAWTGGSMQAFEQLYARYRAPLYRYLLRLAADDAVANDLYQGCWEKVIRARGRYKPSAPFRAWLFRIARNHAVDHFRRHRPGEELREDQAATDNPGPAERLATGDRSDRLRDAIRQLPYEQRDAILLRMDAGLDLETMAAITGVGRETVKSRLRYAVRKLRQAMEDSEGIQV